MTACRIRRILLVVFMSVGVFAPAADTVGEWGFVCKGGDLFVRTELFFGLGRAEGPDVTEAEFRQFLAQNITPRFPDGLTELTGQGQFRLASGVIIREPSKLVILLYPPKQEDADKNIEQIREEYKEAFDQEAVLRTDSVACVSF